MGKSCLPFVFLALLWAVALPAQAARDPLPPQQIRVDELLRDTQKSSSAPDVLDLVWWVPSLFWETMLSQDASVTPGDRADIVDTFGDYTLVAVAHGRMGPLGTSIFLREEEVRGELQLVDVHGVAHRPLAADQVDAKVGTVLSVMRPVFANLLGQLGSNIHFFAFPSRDAQGRAIADPLGDGRLVARVKAQEYAFRLPLGSALVPMRDAVSGETFPGSYSFNPYTGAALEAVDIER